MCVGITGKVESIENGMAWANFSGARRQVSVELISGIRPGDYIMVHAGIAIARVTAKDAEETQSLWEEIYGM